MSPPPIQKDWWLAAALTGAALPAAMGQAASTTEEGRQTGVVTSATQDASTASTSMPIYVDNTRGQRLSTGPNQSLHVLFSDQSAITLGPNSEVVIAEYRYDPVTKEGALVLDMPKGLLRVVGGFISKTNETVVRTGTGEIGIRGGITVVEKQGAQTSSNFLFGQGMRVTDNNGNTQTVTRQGFGIDLTDTGISSPRTTSSGNLSLLMGQFEARSTGQQPSSGQQQPGGAPPGQLLSTGDRPGASTDPGGTLANDRLSTGQAPVQTQNISSSETLRNVLTTVVPVQS